MTAATPETKAKPVRKTKRCKNPACKRPFTSTTITKIYCSTSCKNAVGNFKKKVDPIQKAMGCAFFYWIAGECQRAGTYQILTGHDVESMVELYKVYIVQYRANKFGTVRDYNVSHIAPVKGGDVIGLLFADNLVVAPAGLNKKHRTQHFGGGRLMSRVHLLPKYHVDERDSRKVVVGKVFEFLGMDVVTATIKQAGIKPTTASKDRAWLCEHLDPLNEEHRVVLDSLESIKGKALTDLVANMKAEMAGEEVKPKKVFKITVREYGRFEVLLYEWRRHVTYRPELQVYLDMFDAARATGSCGVADSHLQTMFDLLHGKTPAQLEHELAALIHEHTVVVRAVGVEGETDIWGWETIQPTPYVAPIVSRTVDWNSVDWSAETPF